MRSALILAVLLVCSFTIEAYAHGGRTNSAGCHNNRKTGGYHCHGKKSKSSSSYKSSYKAPSYRAPTQSTKPVETTQQKKKTAYDHDVFQAQSMLNELGYNTGKPDGIYGPKTRRAIESYQSDRGFTITGKVTPLLIRQLKLRISKLSETKQS